MFYAGRNNKVYRKYAKYRDWLYAADNAVRVAIGVSLFTLVDMLIIDTWYVEGISSREATMYAIIREVA